MAPTPTGTASCMKLPRARTVLSASAKSRAPEATSAEYSPSEWPARKEGAMADSSLSTLSAATLAARMAGCVLAVSFSSSSGPSKQRRDSEKPSASSASSKLILAILKLSASSFPIPACWEPCPGKMNA